VHASFLICALVSDIYLRTSKAVMLNTFRRIDDMLVKTMIAAESEMTPRMYTDCNYR
jgi:hypothetical protein